MNDTEAGGRLVTAARIRERVRRGGRWAIWHYVAHAAIGYLYLTAFGVVVTSYGTGPALRVIVLALIAYLVLAGLAARKRVRPSGYDVRLAVVMVTWTMTTLLVMIVGATFFLHTPAFWPAAAVLPSAVMIVGGILEYREARR